jgi:hypothetical protein
MNLPERKALFEKNLKPAENVILSFTGIEGFDVYNCSVPFEWQGKRYIYGRVERRSEWAHSWVRLFFETGKDSYALVKDSMIYQLEDPFMTFIGEEIVLGGTHVRLNSNQIDTYYGYFYRGKDLEDLRYFATGPDYMKDIRLVELPEGIGVFSRPRDENVIKEYGSDSVVGFTIIPDLDHLDSSVIARAKVIPGLFSEGEWGGCNQCFFLESGNIGVIGHKSFQSIRSEPELVYMNIAFVFDPKRNSLLDEKIIAVRNSYPSGPPKKPNLNDCAFTSGIVMHEDGSMADLYSGLGDTCEGRVVISYPFEGYGKIITPAEISGRVPRK